MKMFFDALYGNSQGFVDLRALGGHSQPWQEFSEIESYDRIHSFSVTATLQKRNVYFGVATRDGKAGKKENIVNIPAVWTDIDFKDTPRENALKALRDFPYKASVIVDSGGGVHCYWILKEPLSPLDDETTISRIEDVNKRITARLGGDPSSTDATRILRLPDTRNFKYDPARPVKVTYLEKWQYELEPFLEVLPEAPQKPAQMQIPLNGKDKATYVNENVTALMKCNFIRWCAKKQAEVKEPLWHALISNLASVRPGGVTLCHDLSKGHPGYSQQETNEKILHCLEESKPMSCAKIQARGFECKKNCLVNSPAGLIFDIGCYDYSGDRTSDSRIKISFSERQGSVQQVAIS